MKSLIVFLIRFYQVFHHSFFSGCCRFHPTCSEYTAKAVKSHGSLMGVFLGVKRIFRCHPFGGYGYDPVPPPNTPKKEALSG